VTSRAVSRKWRLPASLPVLFAAQDVLVEFPIGVIVAREELRDLIRGFERLVAM
jgi:hypothetical protein